MPYIESDTALPRNHKTKRAARLLKCRRSEIVGCLHCLWSWAIDNAADGDLSGFTAEEIAEEADWDGDPDAFIRALKECGKEMPEGGRGAGFLEVEDGRLIIHHWYIHGGGKLIEARQADAYQKWLKRNNRPDTPEAFEEWKAGPKGRRRTAKEAALPASGDVRTTSDGHPQDVGGCRDIEQQQSSSSTEQHSVAYSSSSTEGSVRGDTPSGEDAAAAAAALPNGKGLPGFNRAAGDNPQLYVSRTLSQCPAHYVGALDRIWKQRQAAGAQHEYPVKARILSDWVTGQEPPPEAPRKPVRAAPATPAPSQPPQPRASPPDGLTAARETIGQLVGQEAKQKPPTEEEQAEIDEQVRHILADPVLRAEAMQAIEPLIPAEVRDKPTLLQSTTESQLRRWARERVRAGGVQT